VRFRIDGVLREVLRRSACPGPLLVSRIKVMARLDIAEKRVPQDGRISLRIAGHAVDVRVSTLPSAYGERVVLRLLDKQAGQLELAQLGMPPTPCTTACSLVCTAPTASCSSPGPRVPARPPRSTRASARSTRPRATS
jgi:type II secretory ATPase GspE/PulE/Tfp pilus assembly ATPase PilB-like protein